VNAGIAANTISNVQYFNPYSHNILESTSPGNTLFTTDQGTNVVQIPGNRSVMSLATVTVANGNIATAPIYNFTLPILSGIIGINSSKFLPLDKLSAGPIRVEMFTSANDDAIYYGTPAAGAVWQLVNVELELCFVEIDEDGFDDVNEIDYIATQSYRQTSSSLPATYGGEYTTILPFRIVSLTALYNNNNNNNIYLQL
jgi:hypothetical protein